MKFLKHRFTSLLILTFLSINCGGGKGLIVSPELNKFKNKKILVIVSRIGTKYPYNSPLEITPETDYSANELGLRNDIVIEDSSRIKKSMPFYPSFEEYRAIHYYKNITPEITQTVSNILKKKGYRVIDIKTLNKNIMKMKVSEILKSVKDKCDLVMFFHYVDIGSITAPAVMHEGVSGLFYRIAIYSPETGEKLFRYYAEHNHFSFIESLANDRDLVSSGKVKPLYNNYGELVGANHNLSNEERLSLILKYMTSGLKKEIRLKKHHGPDWKGLEKLIP